MEKLIKLGLLTEKVF